MISVSHCWWSRFRFSCFVSICQIHCEINFDESTETYHIKDRKSASGTFVNGTKLSRVCIFLIYNIYVYCRKLSNINLFIRMRRRLFVTEMCCGLAVTVSSSTYTLAEKPVASVRPKTSRQRYRMLHRQLPIMLQIHYQTWVQLP